MSAPALDRVRRLLGQAPPELVTGRVTGVTGLLVAATMPDAFIGEVCEIHARHGEGIVQAEVVGFRSGEVLLMALGSLRSIGQNCEVTSTGSYLRIPTGEGLRGCVLDGLGRVLYGKPGITERHDPVYNEAPHPIFRQRIREQIFSGVKAIDTMLPCGEGQRVGIFAAAGGGKSTLLGRICRHSSAEVNVVVLVGERGREVNEFIEDSLGDGIANSVVVVATADQPPVVRLKAAYVGTTIAEYFRDKGRKVLLMVDSITRFARAQREIGLARGEPPARYGFPPSVFAELPMLFERCGKSSGRGSITGFYTVLVEGDNLDEPVADETKSLLDGHIILSPKVGYRPAIDLALSESRVKWSLGISDPDADAREKIAAFLAQYRKDEQDIDFGFFDKVLGEKRRKEKRKIDEFMAQSPGAAGLSGAAAYEALRRLAAEVSEVRPGRAAR
jgi:FliI/YscN family ATPase